MTIEAVIFDYDGVIVNSFSNQFNVMKHICEKHDRVFPYKTPKALRDEYQEPFTVMYDKCGFDWEHDKEFLKQDFNDYQAQQGSEVPLVKGIDRFLYKLHREFKLGIVTQNTQMVVARKLKQYALDSFFSSIITYEDVARIKPHPDGIIRCLGELHDYADEAVYIGDMPSDVKTAKAAGVFSISYLGGYGTKKKFKELPKEEYEYTIFVKKPREILEYVRLR